MISCHVELGHSTSSNAASIQVGHSAGFQCCFSELGHFAGPNVLLFSLLVIQDICEYYATHYYSNCAGGSTDTSGMSAEGITGHVLLILTEVISILFWLITFAHGACVLLG